MVRQWLRQRCRYQLDYIVPNRVVHTSTCGSDCGNGAASSVRLRQQQNILHYIACYFAAATAAQNGVGIQLITAPLPQLHRVNGP